MPFVVSVLTPEEAMRRYNHVLLAVKRGRSKTAAYQKVGVDRKTITDLAAISECHAVDEQVLRATVDTNETLIVFSARSRARILQADALKKRVEVRKKIKEEAGKLLNITYRKT